METFTRNHKHNADKLTFRKVLVIEACVDYHVVCMMDVVISQFEIAEIMKNQRCGKKGLNPNHRNSWRACRVPVVWLPRDGRRTVCSVRYLS